MPRLLIATERRLNNATHTSPSVLIVQDGTLGLWTAINAADIDNPANELDFVVQAALDIPGQADEALEWREVCGGHWQGYSGTPWKIDKNIGARFGLRPYVGHRLRAVVTTIGNFRLGLTAEIV